MIVIGYIVAFVALDWISYIYSLAPPLAITPWNPPPGLSLMLLLRGGLQYTPWLFVAATSAELLVRSGDLGPASVLAAAALPTLFYAGLAWLLQRRHVDPECRSLRDCALFVAFTAITTGALALSFVTVVFVLGMLPEHDYWRSVSQFWIGDFLGILVTTPLLLIWSRGRRALDMLNGELVLQIAVLIGLVWVIFGSKWIEELKLFYVLFLPIIWIAMRGGIERTTMALAVVQVSLIVAMRLGGYGSGVVLEFQFLLLSLALTGLFLGATVSEARAMSRELREKQVALEHSVRLTAASEMASALAHELNQPLSAIGSYLNACQVIAHGESPQPALLRDILAKAVAEVARAGRVMRQIRDFFRTGAGHIEALQVASTVQGVVAGLRQREEAQHVRWHIRCPEGMPAVLVDRVQMETVLHNLVANAIDAVKHLPADRQEIVITSRQEGPLVRISVTDSGQGIADEVKTRLFAPFATSKPEGMGLGLAISRSLVEARGGRLWLENDAPKTTFTFTLPVESM